MTSCLSTAVALHADGRLTEYRTLLTGKMACTNVRTRRLACLVVMFICLFPGTLTTRECRVTLSLGEIRGNDMRSHNRREFCSYRGIPYARPPINELRFKEPQPVSPWNRTLNARRNGPKCIQKFGVIVGEEDCLYLNVYTPIMNNRRESYQSLLPVIMYIHGGQFIIGSGVSSLTGPEYLLDKDIVLVTINYRLGVLGFLSTGDDELPGNYGMKDQVAALHWIQQHIANFGGDPNKVTIQGESAGSKSVHYHLFSPIARGLFNGAISESGSAFMPWVIPPNDPLQIAQKQAKAVGCLRNKTANMVRCFRQISARELVSNQLSLWGPVVEVKTKKNPHPYITASPLQLVKTGDFAKVPWLVGGNSHDGAYFGAQILSMPSQLEKFYKNINTQGPKDFFLSLSVNKSEIPTVWKSIEDFYFGSGLPRNNEESNEKLNELYTDRYVLHSVHRAVLEHSNAGHRPIFYYNFGYRGLYSYTDLVTVPPQDLGVVHLDELIYLIPSRVFTTWPPGHPDLETINKMVTLWTNFATYGDPTPFNGAKSGGLVWHPVGDLKINGGHIDYLNISNAAPDVPAVYGVRPVTFHMDKDLYKERMQFFDSLPLRENQ